METGGLKSKIAKLLRWSEKYTKTDMVYLARGGFWLTFGQVISAGASFLMAIAFANLLPKEVYGTYKFVLSIAGILAIPTLQGMATAVTRAVAQGYEGTVIPALKEKVKWGSLAGIASLAASGYYWHNGNITLTFSFLIAAGFLPFMDSFGIFNSYLLGKKDFGRSTRYGIVIKLVPTVAMIAAVLLSGNLFIILLAYFLSYTILRMAYYFSTVKLIQKKTAIQPEAIGYGKHLSLMGVIGTIANQIDKVLLFHYLGAVELAVYSIAIAPVEQIKGILRNIGFLSLPKFAEKEKSEVKKNILPKMLKFGLLTIAIVVLYILLAPLIFRIFFSAYTDSIFYSQIFSISLIAIVALLPYSALEATGEKNKLYQYNSISPILQIILMIILTISYGIIGTITARVLTRLFNILLSIWLIKKD